MKTFGRAILLSAACFTVQAAPVQWYLSQVTFSDGGRAVGSFVFDRATGVFTNVNVQTTPGTGTTSAASAIAGGNYGFSRAPGIGTPPAVEFFTDPRPTPTTRRIRLLASQGSLTDNGGTVLLTAGSVEGFCADTATCVNVSSSGASRSITGGALVAVSSTSARTWYLNATFDDGGQAIGSFVYDAATNTYSSIDISTTAGSTFTTGARMQSPLAGSTAAVAGFVAQTPTVAGTRFFIFTPTGPLSNGDVTLNNMTAPSAESTCATAICNTVGPAARQVTSGGLTTVRPANYTRILSQIADGGGWLTGILINNLTDRPASYALTFAQDDGTPFQVGGIGSYVATTVPPRGVSFLTSTGAAALIQGWGKLDGGHNFSVTSIFTAKNANAGGDQQGSVIGDAQGTTSITVPFDNVGATVGLALTNPSSSPVTVLAVGYDETGRILMTDSSVVLPANGHTAFAFPGTPGYSTLVNRRGSLRLFAIHGGVPPYMGINALLLKFLPNGSFTTIGVANQ